MGKSLNGRELGKGITQRKDGSYTARYVDKYGVRKSLYASNINDIRQKLKAAKFDDENRTVAESNVTLPITMSLYINLAGIIKFYLQ